MAMLVTFIFASKSSLWVRYTIDSIKLLKWLGASKKKEKTENASTVAGVLCCTRNGIATKYCQISLGQKLRNV